MYHRRLAQSAETLSFCTLAGPPQHAKSHARLGTMEKMLMISLVMLQNTVRHANHALRAVQLVRRPRNASRVKATHVSRHLKDRVTNRSHMRTTCRQQDCAKSVGSSVAIALATSRVHSVKKRRTC